MSTKARVLKGSKMSLNHDLTKRTLQCINKLRETATEFNKAGKTTKIKGTRLQVEDEWYSWDAEKDKLQKIRQNNPFPAPPQSTIQSKQ